MSVDSFERPIEILMAEDNPGDIRLTREALKDGKVSNSLNVVNNGSDALAYLRKQPPFENMSRPDLILLDLNLPKINGIEVLQEIKTDETLKLIPVVILTTSKSEQDITSSYQNHANCYITKPVDLDQFMSAINAIDNFWLSIVRLPTE